MHTGAMKRMALMMHEWDSDTGNSKIMKSVLNMMESLFKLLDFVFKMLDFVFKMLDFVFRMRRE